MGVAALALLELDGRAAQGGVQFAAHGEEGIAHGLEFQALDIGAPQEAVLGVQFGVTGIVLAALLINAGKHDEAVEFFDGPTVLHEAGGQVIEQFGMARRVGLVAEIVRGGDKALAEMMHPDAVDQDAGGEGVVGVDDGLGQLEAAAAMRKGGGLGPAMTVRKWRGTMSPLLPASPRMNRGESWGLTMSQENGARGAGNRGRWLRARRRSRRAWLICCWRMLRWQVGVGRRPAARGAGCGV